MRKRKMIFLWMTALGCMLAGCTDSRDEHQEYQEVEFTVVAEEKWPEQLRQAIEKNREKEIRMTYLDGEDLYLIRGYGQQESGGYSIAVAECSENETELFFDTRLIGPKEKENGLDAPSWPVLVVKIEAREKDIVIQ